MLQIHVAGVAAVVADAVEAAFTGHLHRAGRVRAGDDDGRAGFEHGVSRLALQVGIEPGEDPADVHFALGAGLTHAQRGGVGVANHFGDGERGHVADPVAAVFGGAGARNHADQILHAFHGAEQVGEVGLVLLEPGDVHEVHIREFLGHGRGRVHVAERGGEDGVEALARQVANHAFGVSAFGHAFQIGRGDLVAHGFFQILAAFVVGVGPAAVTDGADVDECHVELAFFDLRNLDGARCCGFGRGGFGCFAFRGRAAVTGRCGRCGARAEDQGDNDQERKQSPQSCIAHLRSPFVAGMD